MTCTSSSCRTVTGTCRPSAWNRRVIPTFFAITPVRMIKTPQQRPSDNSEGVQPIQILRAPPGLVLPKGSGGDAARSYPPAVSPNLPREGPRLLRQLDLNVDAGGQIELHQRVDRLRRGLHDVEQPLVGSHLELLARLLVDVRRAVDGELLNARRQRDRTADESTRPARRVGNVAGGLIEHSMIERLQANPDVLRFHIPTDAKEPANRSRSRDPLKKLLTNCKPRES